MSESKFVPGEKVKISDMEKIKERFPNHPERSGVMKWSSRVLTFSKYGEWFSIHTEEADITFHSDIVEKLPFKAPEHLFQIKE